MAFRRNSVTAYVQAVFLFLVAAATHAASLSGVITENGSPLAGAVATTGETNSNVSDNTGFFQLTVEAGEHTITVMSAGGEFIGMQTVTVNDSESATANFDFTPWTLAGTVTENGIPLGGATVAVGLNDNVTTDAGGNFSVRVQDEQVTVSTFSPQNILIDQRMVVHEGTGALSVSIATTPATLMGVVTENGAPLEGARIDINAGSAVTTGIDGTFTLQTQPGTVPVQVFSGQGEHVGQDVRELSAGQTTSVAFSFEPLSLSGTVTQDGNPVSGIKVLVGANNPVITDDQGQYATRVTAGTWPVIAVDATGKVITEKVVTMESTSVVVDLP